MTPNTRAFIVGRLTQAPEVTTSDGGVTASFSLAAIESVPGRRDLPQSRARRSYRVQVRGKLAETVGLRLSAGMSVCVEGVIANRTFEPAADGNCLVDQVRLEALHVLAAPGEAESRRPTPEEACSA